METSKLYKIAERSGIDIGFSELPHTKAFCIRVGDKKYIAVDKAVRSGSAEERVLLAHELGHLSTDSLYELGSPLLYRKRFELKADIWAIKTLVPHSLLKEAVRQGYESVASLAEHFSVTEDFMQRAIKYYSES